MKQYKRKRTGRKRSLRLLSAMLCLCLLVTACPYMPGVTVVHAAVVNTWDCGSPGSGVTVDKDTPATSAVRAELDANGTMTISGVGDMADYYNWGAPWYSDNRKDIKKIVIKPGVTKIGKYAFQFSAVTEVTIADSVTEIRESAFMGCSALPKVTIPGKVTYMYYVFRDCENLAEVTFEGTDTIPRVRENVFQGCKFVTENTKGIIIPSCKYLTAYKDAFALGQYKDYVGTEHSLEHVGGVAATCVKQGTIEHYKCSVCGATFKDSEGEEITYSVIDYRKPHNYHYTASGNTITQTCDRGCDLSATARLSLKSGASRTYTGNPVTPVEVICSDNWAGDKPTVTYKNNTDAGTATASMTVSDTSTDPASDVTASLDFEITPATITGVSASGYTGTYDGAAHGITVTAPTGATVKYRKGSSGSYTLDSSPTYTDAGTYTVYYQVTKPNHTTQTGSETVTINKRSISSATVTLQNVNLIYNGAEQTKGVSSIVVNGRKLAAGDYTVSGNKQTNAGTYTITITGKGNYSGTKTTTFTIATAAMNITASDYKGTYDGAAHGITVTAPTGATVKYRKGSSGSYTLDSSPTYTDAGTYTVYYQVTKPNHTTQTGSRTVTINRRSISGATVALQSGNLIYNGAEQTKGVSSIVVNSRTLAAGDYTVSGNKQTNAGAYTITITGKGNYTGTATKTFTIARKPLTTDMITIASGPHYYTGSAIEPAVTVEDGKKLTGAEYSVSYAENVNVGTAEVTVTGTGNYTGSIEKTFGIAARSISSATVALKSGILTYNGEPQTQEVGSVTVNGRELAPGTDYQVTGNTGTDARTYHTLTITGKGNYTGTKTVDFKIAPKPLADSMVTVASGPHYYTGRDVTPAVTVTDGSIAKDLVKDTDYTVSYANNVNQGTAKVTVAGAGNYAGTISREFTIGYRPLPDGRLEDYVSISPDPRDGWWRGDISLTPGDNFEVGDTPAGIGSSAVTVSQESGTDGSTKTIYVKDSDGNIYQAEFSYKLDKTPPAADLTGMTVKNGTKDLWNWIIGKKSMIIKIPVSGITDVLSGIAEVPYTATSENGGTGHSGILQAQGGYYEIALNAEFSGKIQLTAEDKAGNTTQASLTADSGKVIAEDYAPVVTFTMPDTPEPNADGWYNTAVTVTVAVTDNKDSNSGAILSGGIAGIRWKDGEDGAEQTVTGLPGTAPVYQKTFTIDVNSGGTHTYYVNAVDNAGNESGWQTVTVKVDTGEPDFSGDITVTNPTKEGADVTFTPSEGGKVYWIVSDAGTEPDAKEVKEQSGQKGGVQDIAGGTEGSFTITGLTPGEKHTVYVVLEDAAGNLSGVKKESFLTLQKAPEITPEQLTIDYADETIKLPDNIGKVEVYTDPQHPETSKVTPDTDGFLPVTPGTAVYIRYPKRTEDGLTAPASDKTEIQIPGRPAVPAAKDVTVTDTTAAVIHPGSDEEYVLVKKGDAPDWGEANTTGQFTGLDPNQEYDLYVRKKATENSFVSEPAKTGGIRTFVTIKKPDIEGDGAGKDGNTAPRPDAPDKGGSTVTYTGTYGEEYIPVIKAGGQEIIPGDKTAGSEMTWEEETKTGTWEYTYPVPDGAAEVEITVEFRKRTLTGITAEPGSLAIYADDAANAGMEALNDYVKENSRTCAVYDNKTSGTVQAAYTTTDSFEPKGGTYSYTVSAGGKTANATLTVSPVSAVVTAPDKCLQRQKAGGYTEEEVAAWLPAQATVTYTGTGYTARTENRAATWDTGSIGTDFGAETGRKTITGTVDLPAWVTGGNDVSIEIEFVEKNILKDDQIQLAIQGFCYGAQTLPDPQGSITVEDTNPAYAYLYSTDSGATWVTADKLPESGGGYIIPGEYKVKVAYTGDDYIGEKTASFTVAKKELTVLPGTLEAENKNYDGTMDASLKTGGKPELSGVAAGDDVTPGGSLNAVFSKEGPEKDIPVTVTGFRLEGRDALCYELKNSTVTLYATINNADGTPPATKEEKPDIRIDYRQETLTGFTPEGKYDIIVNENKVTITADTDGNLKLEEEWLGTTVSIVKCGNGKDKLDSDALSLTIPGRNAQTPSPQAADESRPGAADGKLAGLEADKNYQISADDGATWTEISADKNGEITKLAPGSYIVRESGTDSAFAGRPSVKVTIAAGQETGPETEHKYPEQWTVEKEATEKEPGREYKICETCGTKIYRTIDPLGTPADPYAGKIEKEVEVLPGAPDTILNNSREELAESVLTPEEIAEVDKGAADAKIWLEVVPDVKISETEKEQVQKAAEETVGEGAEVTYFDASLFKQVGNGKKTIIHEPKKPVSVTIVIPEGIRNKDVLMVRNYHIIRLHNGKTDLIEGKYNEESAEFTFETDKFSIYAVSYKDSPKQAEPATPAPGGTAEPGTPAAVSDESGQTGNEIEKRKDLSILLATGKQKGSRGIKLTWLKWQEASGYEVYWSYCDGEQNYKKRKTVKAAAKRTYTHKKRKKNRAYKYYIAAYKMVDGKKKYVAKSPVIHVAMKYEKRTNVKKITANKTKVILSLTNEGYKKTYKARVKVKKENRKKKLLTHVAKLRYYTDDKEVAVVSRTGKITARGRGKCTVYVIANNGVCRKIAVTVK